MADNTTENNSSISLVDFSKTKLLGQIYTDLAQPSVQKVGKALGTVFELSNTFVTPLWFLNEVVSHKKEVFKNNMNKLKDKLDEIPEEKICEVVPEIGVPIVEKLTYVTNDQLREAYLNLLTKASSSDTALLAHPAFASMLDKISSDEAKIIQFLSSKSFFVFIDYKLNINPGGWHTHKKFATGLEYDLELDYPQNINIYIDNLINLGIITFEKGYYKMDETLYSKLREKYTSFEQELEGLTKVFKFAKNQSNIPEQFKKMMPESANWSFDKGSFDITDFGRLFIQACNNNEPTQNII